jgi:hypothetical protein
VVLAVLAMVAVVTGVTWEAATTTIVVSTPSTSVSEGHAVRSHRVGWNEVNGVHDEVRSSRQFGE